MATTPYDPMSIYGQSGQMSDPLSLTTNEMLNQMTGGPTLGPNTNLTPPSIGALQVANKLAMNPPAPGSLPPAMHPGVSLTPPVPPENPSMGMPSMPAPLSMPTNPALANSIANSPALAPATAPLGGTEMPVPEQALQRAPTEQPYRNKGMDIAEQAQQELLDSLDRRKNPQKDSFLGLDPKWLSVAQGFLAPTRTGSFGEALGNVAGNINKLNETENEQKRKDLMMRMELGKSMSDTETKKEIQKLVPQLYGADNKLNIPIAKQYAAMTGDTKFLQTVIAEESSQKQKDLVNKVFKINEVTNKNGEKVTKFSMDNAAWENALTKSPDAVKVLKDLGELRQSLLDQGMMMEQTDRENPFKYYSTIPNRVIQQEALNLSKRFEQGMSQKEIDKAEERLSKRAQDVLHQQELLAAQRGQTAIAEGLKMSQQALNEEKLARLKETLTPQQMKTYEKLIIPLKTDQTKSENYNQTLEKLEQYAKDAPDGPLEFAQYQVKRLTNSNDPMVSAMNNLIGEKAKAVTEIPKFSQKGTVYDEILHGKIIGNLDDYRLTRQQRLDAIKRLREDNDAQDKLNQKILDHWNETKEYAIPKGEKKDEGKTVDFNALPPRR
jgi:hypothetical protein